MLRGWEEKLITVEVNCGFLAKHTEPAYLSLRVASTFHRSDTQTLGYELDATYSAKQFLQNTGLYREPLDRNTKKEVSIGK